MARPLAAHLNRAEDAESFAARWREKQLEYSFRRALMRRYVPFSECTKSALEFVCAERRENISPAARAALLAIYGELPAFADAAPCLQNLAKRRLFAFSNGETAAVEKILAHNRLAGFFTGIVSADEVQSFKPAPEVYARFLSRAESRPEDTWLISANPFDIIGARAAGWRAAWLQRGAPFDPWDEFRPDKTVSSLAELPEVLP